jgi:hypothetical protein
MLGPEGVGVGRLALDLQVGRILGALEYAAK